MSNEVAVNENESENESEDVNVIVLNELRTLKEQKRKLEALMDKINFKIEKKIKECNHKWMRQREDGLYGGYYYYCTNCESTR